MIADNLELDKIANCQLMKTSNPTAHLIPRPQENKNPFYAPNTYPNDDKNH